jgi:DNA polymerase-3 subunit gamma/tau
MLQAGSDPLQILQDMCDLVHLLTRGQVVTEFVNEQGLPEYDRQLLMDVADIKIPALTRAWQILLKGIAEVQAASHPSQAAEMVLIRLAYASDLPSPAELVKKLRESTASTNASGHTSPPTSGGGSRAKLALGGGGAVSHQAQAVAPPLEQPEPPDYRDIVALFAEKREAGLHAILFGQVHLVRCEPGLLELRVGASAPANLAGRVGQCLTEWTGQRWIVSVSASEGQPTLAEQERAAEAKRQERARTHPIMQAVFSTFPDAKLVALRQRTIIPTATVGEDSLAATDSDLLINESED